MISMSNFGRDMSEVPELGYGMVKMLNFRHNMAKASNIDMA